MNSQEFETEVRKLRQLQRRFFACRKDNPDRAHVLETMREQEQLVGDVVKVTMAIRRQNSMPKSDRESFFLDVAEMLRRQKTWMRNGGGIWMMNPARELEAKVDKQLNIWNEQRKAERERRIESELKKQKSLFDETYC